MMAASVPVGDGMAISSLAISTISSRLSRRPFDSAANLWSFPVLPVPRPDQGTVASPSMAAVPPTRRIATNGDATIVSRRFRIIEDVCRPARNPLFLRMTDSGSRGERQSCRCTCRATRGQKRPQLRPQIVSGLRTPDLDLCHLIVRDALEARDVGDEDDRAADFDLE